MPSRLLSHTRTPGTDVNHGVFKSDIVRFSSNLHRGKAGFSPLRLYDSGGVIMNPNQFATMDEAKSIAKQLGTMGGGVRDIYVPDYFGPFSAPDMGPAKFLHYRFANGADGFNVGLIRTTMNLFPWCWPQMIGTEVYRGAKDE